MEDLKARERRSDFNEDDEEFFVKHRRLIEQDAKLCARWEKALYGKPIECNDFFDGFARVVNSLHAGLRDAEGERILRFTVTKGRKEWRERFNYDAGSYFSAMYRGLKELMGSKADWKVERLGNANLPDPLFDYEAFFAKEKELRNDKKNKVRPSSSLSRVALQIKFDVALIQVSKGKETVLAKTQLLWSYKPTSIGLSMVADMRRLLEKGAVGCTEVPRRLVSKKGGVQNVSLLDTGTLEATYSTDAGSLVPAANKLRSLRHEIKGRIKELADEGGYLTPSQRDEIRASWDKFEEDYIKAMEDFVSIGLHGEAVMRQAESFGALLTTLMAHARGDVCRSRLVSEVLSIGTARVAGDNPALIIPPWHPERMKALGGEVSARGGFRYPLALERQHPLWRSRDLHARALRRDRPSVLSGDRGPESGGRTDAGLGEQHGQRLQPLGVAHARRRGRHDRRRSGRSRQAGSRALGALCRLAAPRGLEPQRRALQRRRGRAAAGDGARALVDPEDGSCNAACRCATRTRRSFAASMASWSTRPATIRTCPWSARPATTSSRSCASR